MKHTLQVSAITLAKGSHFVIVIFLNLYAFDRRKVYPCRIYSLVCICIGEGVNSITEFSIFPHTLQVICNPQIY